MVVGAFDLLMTVDEFVKAEKRIHGFDQAYQWSSGYSSVEVQCKFPLEVDGELPENTHLLLVGFPAATEIKFRLSLCYSAAVCRLDYTDETHGTTHAEPADNLPPLV